MKIRSSLRNQNGFTLVEAVVGSVVLGIAFFALADVSNLLSRSTAYGERSQALIALQDRMRQRLTYQEMCDASIGSASGQNQGTIDIATLTGGHQQISIKLPGLRGGTTFDSDIAVQGQTLFLSKLKIDGIRLTDVRSFAPNSYVAQVEVTAESTAGIAFRPVSATTVQFTVNGSGIDHCVALSSNITQQICQNMGCSWNPAATPNCVCQTVQVTPCPLGQYPTGFSGGRPQCSAFGGACPSGQYMTGMSLDGGVTCAPLPP